MGESEYAVNFFIVFTGGWLGVQRPPQTFLKVLSVFFSALPRDVGALQHVLLSQQMLCVALFSTVVLFRCLCFLFKFDKFINTFSCRWRHYFQPFYCYCSDWLLRSGGRHAKIWPQVTTMLQRRTENEQQMNKQASTMLQILQTSC